MPLYQVAKRIAGRVGNVSLDLVLETMKQALILIYQEHDWSFQRGITYANWLAPGNVGSSNGGPNSAGTSTVTPYSPEVILDGAATAGINAYTATIGSVFLTTLQYRDPSYSIYNIIGVVQSGQVGYLTITNPGVSQIPGVYVVDVLDIAGGGGYGGTVQITVLENGMVMQPPVVLTAGVGYTAPYVNFVTSGTSATFDIFQSLLLTLDRPWLEPTAGGGQQYMIYQAYFVAPCKYFNKFIEMRDTTDAQPIDFWSKTQRDLSREDPQRTDFSDPDFCVPAGVDTRPGSSTLGWPMFELYPQQLSYEPYSFSYRSLGPVPETQQDFFTFEPPYPLTDEIVEWRTKEVLFQDKEASRDKSADRGSGANWLMLAQMAQKEYALCLDKITAIDLNLNGEAFGHTQPPGQGWRGQPFANRQGGLNVGWYGTDY